MVVAKNAQATPNTKDSPKNRLAGKRLVVQARTIQIPERVSARQEAFGEKPAGTAKNKDVRPKCVLVVFAIAVFQMGSCSEIFLAFPHLARKANLSSAAYRISQIF